MAKEDFQHVSRSVRSLSLPAWLRLRSSFAAQDGRRLLVNFARPLDSWWLRSGLATLATFFVSYLVFQLPLWGSLLVALLTVPTILSHGTIFWVLPLLLVGIPAAQLCMLANRPIRRWQIRRRIRARLRREARA